jgi:hypothetical protein
MTVIDHLEMKVVVVAALAALHLEGDVAEIGHQRVLIDTCPLPATEMMIGIRTIAKTAIRAKEIERFEMFVKNVIGAEIVIGKESGLIGSGSVETESDRGTEIGIVIGIVIGIGTVIEIEIAIEIEIEIEIGNEIGNETAGTDTGTEIEIAIGTRIEIEATTVIVSVTSVQKSELTVTALDERQVESEEITTRLVADHHVGIGPETALEIGGIAQE